MSELIDKIPGVSSLPKPARIVILVGVVGALGFLGYRYITKNKAAKETPPDAPLGDYTDYPGDGTAPPITSTPVGQPPVGDNEGDGKPKTDGEWVQYAAGLMNTAGYTDVAMVTRVLSLWLQSQPLESDGEVTIVRTAVGLANRPPSGDHPFLIKPAPPTNPTPSQPTSPPTPAAPPPTPAPTSTYTIKRGDTLTKIAAAHHTTVARLVALNGIKNKNLIYAGHTLKLG